MTQEQIENIAENYAYNECVNNETENQSLIRFVSRNGFIKGAKWRIKSVWHKPDEEPDPLKGYLLVGIKPKDADKTIYIFQNADYVLQFSCIRWAYIDDLLPEEE